MSVIVFYHLLVGLKNGLTSVILIVNKDYPMATVFVWILKNRLKCFFSHPKNCGFPVHKPKQKLM